MRKRFIAMLTAGMMAAFCLLPLTKQIAVPQLTAEAAEATDDFAGHGTDLERYGLQEEYAIIPCCAGASAVDVDGGNGRSLQIWSALRNPNQTFTVGKNGDYYYFTCKKNGKAVQLSGALGEGAFPWLEVDTYTGADKQLWSLEYMEDGTYLIRSKAKPDMVMDVNYGRWDNGAALWACYENRSNAQRYRFVHTSTIEPLEEWGASRSDCRGSDWDIWDGSVSTQWYYADPNAKTFYISKASELAGISQLVRDGVTSFACQTIVLQRDINLAGIEWTCIGTEARAFQGSFNGGGHAIIGLSLTNTANDADYRGFFGYAIYGSIGNFAIKGSVAGDEYVGGVAGCIDSVHLYNIYSEVSMTRATDDYLGGICGYATSRAYIEHCTQNARVTSGDCDPYRGGIAGCGNGVIRYCKNMQTVDCDWNYVGGIAGQSDGGKIEYCANYGTVGCGGDSKHTGGIIGYGISSVIYCCYNAGRVYSTNAGYVGGICGDYDPKRSAVVEFCINEGSVSGNYDIGGICGVGQCLSCLNLGIVSGDTRVGAISGNTPYGLDHCLALAWSSPGLIGKGSGVGAEWISAQQLISGEACYKLNNGGSVTGWHSGAVPVTPFYQNLGSDPVPSFTGSKVNLNGSIYTNDTYRVDITSTKDYGKVVGGGTYSSGKTVKLTAVPEAGCVFDHYEVRTSQTGKWSRWDGNEGDFPSFEITEYKDAELVLTAKIDRSYSINAVFNVFDDTPDDLKMKAKVTLSCTNGVDGWNSDIIPVYLIDSAGDQHLWEIDKSDLNEEGESQTHDFDLGTASPVALYAYPDFGGGCTVRDLGLKAQMWVNGSGEAMSSGEVTIRSWPFISSKYGDDYMHISFDDNGISRIGLMQKDGTVKFDDQQYKHCKEAWNKALGTKGDVTIQLQSAWLTDTVLEISENQSVTLDLNGYPIIRSIKKTQDEGELFNIHAGATLKIIDSRPDSKTASTFSGGSIQGGRSDDTGGLIECAGTLNMEGGTLYNGGTTDKGGALRLTGNGTANLTNVLISDCWTDKAVSYNNDGGAIYMCDSSKANLKYVIIRNCRAFDYGGAIYLEDDGNFLTCENVYIKTCKADDNEGGGVYQDAGATSWDGGSIQNCRASEDNGGAFYQNNGEVYFRNVEFLNNYTEDNGGAFYSNTDDKAWFIGCTMQGNLADDHGGAVYQNEDHLYMEGCTITNNAAGGDAGGLYIESNASIDISGMTIIKNNDGSDSLDNLVLEDGAFLYDHGVMPGSDIHLCSDSDGEVYLGDTAEISEYKLNNWYHADHGKLELADVKDRNTQLSASVFTDGRVLLYVGAGLLILFAAGGLFYARRKKGGAQ